VAQWFYPSEARLSYYEQHLFEAESTSSSVISKFALELAKTTNKATSRIAVF
jgi:hypothetical protein